MITSLQKSWRKKVIYTYLCILPFAKEVGTTKQEGKIEMKTTWKIQGTSSPTSMYHHNGTQLDDPVLNIYTPFSRLTIIYIFLFLIAFLGKKNMCFIIT